MVCRKSCYRKYLMRCLFALFVLSFLLGCKDNKKAFKDEIVALQSRPLLLPLNDMWCIHASKDSLDELERNGELRLVVYTDTADCSSCVLRKMYLWNGFLEKVESYRGKIENVFIFAPLPEDMGTFRLAMKQFVPSVPVYVDTLGVFEDANPQIPSGGELHTFLLDEGNNVLLVGNPIWNEKIEEMFWQIVEERLGKREMK